MDAYRDLLYQALERNEANRASYLKGVKSASVSVSDTIIGSGNTIIVPKLAGHTTVLTGVLITTDSGKGVASVRNGTKVVIPLYISKQSRAGAGDVNVREYEGDITIEVVDGTSEKETFFGVSYMHVKGR